MKDNAICVYVVSTHNPGVIKRLPWNDLRTLSEIPPCLGLKDTTALHSHILATLEYGVCPRNCRGLLTEYETLVCVTFLVS